MSRIDLASPTVSTWPGILSFAERTPQRSGTVKRAAAYELRLTDWERDEFSSSDFAKLTVEHSATGIQIPRQRASIHWLRDSLALIQRAMKGVVEYYLQGPQLAALGFLVAGVPFWIALALRSINRAGQTGV